MLKCIISDGVSVRIIAGKSLGIESPVRTRTPTYYLDFRLDSGRSKSFVTISCLVTFSSGSQHLQEVSDGWTAFAYILEGKVKIGNEIIDAHNTVLFTHEGDSVEFQNVGSDQVHLVFIAGKPIGRDKF